MAIFTPKNSTFKHPIVCLNVEKIFAMRSKNFTIGQRILLTLAVLADAVDELGRLGGFVGFTYQTVYGWTPPQYRRKNFYALVKRLIKKRYLKQISRGVVILNPEGVEKVDPLRRPFWPKAWNGLWTLVFFDVEEIARKRRDALRFFLKSIGFGMYQRSVWIFPGNLVIGIRRALQARGLGRYALVVLTDDLGIKQPRSLVERLWRVSRLNARYKTLLKKAKKYRLGSSEKREFQVRRLRSSLINLLQKDPKLPLPLLPGDWVGMEAVKTISKL